MVRPGQLPRWRQFVPRGAKRAKRRFFRRSLVIVVMRIESLHRRPWLSGWPYWPGFLDAMPSACRCAQFFFCFVGGDSWPFFVLGLFGWKNWIPDRMLTWMLLPIHWDPQSAWSQWLWRELRIWIERGDESFFGTPPSWLCFRILFCSASLDFNLFALVSWWHQGFVGVHFKPVYTLKKTLLIRKSVAWCAFIDMCCQCSGPRSTMMLSNNWGLSHCHCPHCALLGTCQAFTVGSGQRNWHRTCMPSLHLAGSMFATSMVSTILRDPFKVKRWSCQLHWSKTNFDRFSDRQGYNLWFSMDAKICLCTSGQTVGSGGWFAKRSCKSWSFVELEFVACEASFLVYWQNIASFLLIQLLLCCNWCRMNMKFWTVEEIKPLLWPMLDGEQGVLVLETSKYLGTLSCSRPDQ